MIGEITAVTVALLWSSTALMVKATSERLTVLSLNALRSTAAALFVVVILFAVGKAGLVGQTLLLAYLCLIGSVIIGMGIDDSLYFRSLALVGVSRAMPIAAHGRGNDAHGRGSMAHSMTGVSEDA